MEFVRRLLTENPGASRYKLSRLLCQGWEWRDPKGQLKDMAARSLLLKLEERGWITLPAKRWESPNRMRHKTVGWVEHEREPIVGSLNSLLPLDVRELRSRAEDTPLFECLLQQHHYLSHTSSVGLNLKYLVRDRQGRPVSCLLFGSAAWKCAARDEFIGWSAVERQRALQQITGNTRFLVMPWVEVRHLASHVLSRVLRRLRADWFGKYARPLHLVETFVDQLLTQHHHDLLDLDIGRWRGDLQARLGRIQEHPEQGLGFIEETIRQSALELQRALVQKAMQVKAEALSLRVLGRSLSRSTLARQAQAQGEHAIAVRRHLIQAPVVKAASPLGVDHAPEPFTLVIQIDAWNIRERDHWGATQARRRRNEKLDRWHWVYTATCFRLQHRCRKGPSKNKLRAIITERSYVATRGGIDELMQQLYDEARVGGLAQAQRVLVIADGAVWIWNLASDRFQDAIQRLDLYHANTYLWAVANQLHGAGTPAARQWVKPLLKQVRTDQVAQVITQLQDLKPRMESAAAEVADKTIEYYQNNQQRMKYKDARRRNEPQGSGAIESTCRQLQCRMKRCGQFWSTAGDEALLALEMFWRNHRWELLFPHAKLTGVANN